VTDRQRDEQTSCHGIVRAIFMHMRRAIMTKEDKILISGDVDCQPVWSLKADILIFNMIINFSCNFYISILIFYEENFSAYVRM